MTETNSRRNNWWIISGMTLLTIVWFGAVIATTGVALADPPNRDPNPRDPAFGSQGRVTIPFDLGGDWNDRGNAIVRIPGTGQLVIAGQVASASGVAGESDFGIAMLNPDGTLEPGFGNVDDGLTVHSFGTPETDAAWDLVPVLQGTPPEWRLLVVGQTQQTGSSDIDTGLMYLKPDGMLDLLAPHNGRYIVGWPLTDRLTAAATFDDQRSAVVAGTSETATGTDWFFFKIGENFDVNVVYYDSISFTDVATLEDVATYSDGKVVAAGSVDYHGDARMIVARMTPDGILDIDFGTDGLVEIEVDFDGAADDRAFGVAVDTEDRAIVVGTIGTDDGPMLFMTRLTWTGAVDTDFGNNGYVWMQSMGCEATEARDVVLDPVGTIVIAYEVSCSGNRDFRINRFDQAGQYIEGWSIPFDEITNGDDRPQGITALPDGKIVVAGRVQSVTSDLDFGVAEVTTDVIFAEGFESKGWWGADWNWSP